MPPEAFAKMHGAIRGLKKASKLNSAKAIAFACIRARRRTYLTLRWTEKSRLSNRSRRDFENKIHLAVTVEDDPGRDFGIAKQIGHRFFFGPEEVELV